MNKTVLTAARWMKRTSASTASSEEDDERPCSHRTRTRRDWKLLVLGLYNAQYFFQVEAETALDRSRICLVVYEQSISFCAIARPTKLPWPRSSLSTSTGSPSISLKSPNLATVFLSSSPAFICLHLVVSKMERERVDAV